MFSKVFRSSEADEYQTGLSAELELTLELGGLEERVCDLFKYFSKTIGTLLENG